MRIDYLLLLAETASDAAHGEEHVLAPEATKIFSLAGIPVTNTVLSAWLVMAVLLLVAWAVTRNLKAVPSGAQNVVEAIIEAWIGVIEQVAGKRGRMFVPLVVTAFLFILGNNWIGLLPIFGNVTWFRSANSDLNLTAAMAIVVFISVQVWGIKSMGVGGYLKEFVVPNPLHIITELSRPLSLSLRLFGNVFAGEVLLETMVRLAPPVLFIFLGLEMFVGVVQALIFAMLTLAFLSIATAHGHGAEAEEQHH
ncbi:MAG: F0F1 ATP synthase subunit A [Chloroflexota bacterium]